jgi:hypothetical protein
MPGRGSLHDPLSFASATGAASYVASVAQVARGQTREKRFSVPELSRWYTTSAFRLHSERAKHALASFASNIEEDMALSGCMGPWLSEASAAVAAAIDSLPDRTPLRHADLLAACPFRVVDLNATSSVKQLLFLQCNFVITYMDKAANHFVLVCKKAYIQAPGSAGFSVNHDVFTNRMALRRLPPSPPSTYPCRPAPLRRTRRISQTACNACTWWILRLAPGQRWRRLRLPMLLGALRRKASLLPPNQQATQVSCRLPLLGLLLQHTSDPCGPQAQCFFPLLDAGDV